MKNKENKQFEKFVATHLYCDNCGQSMPVAETLLLVLPDGNLYDYRCRGCGKSVGERKESGHIIQIQH